MRKIQVFIHDHYESIKLILLIVIFITAFFSIIGQIKKNNQDAADRAATVETILDGNKQVNDAIKRETENQTVIINRQFRALCILIIETSGQEGLDKLDPDSKARCEELATDPTGEGEGVAGSPQQSASPPNSSGNQSSSSTNNTPSDPPRLPENPQNPPEPPKSMLRFVPGVNDPLVGCVRMRCI